MPDTKQAGSVINFVPSFQPAPITVTDNTNPAPGVTLPPVTRIITPQ